MFAFCIVLNMNPGLVSEVYLECLTKVHSGGQVYCVGGNDVTGSSTQHSHTSVWTSPQVYQHVSHKAPEVQAYYINMSS